MEQHANLVTQQDENVMKVVEEKVAQEKVFIKVSDRFGIFA
jgi:hypothetical protein